MSNMQLLALAVITLGFIAAVSGVIMLATLIVVDLLDRAARRAGTPNPALPRRTPAAPSSDPELGADLSCRGLGEPRPHIAPQDPIAPRADNSSLRACSGAPSRPIRAGLTEPTATIFTGPLNDWQPHR